MDNNPLSRSELFERYGTKTSRSADSPSDEVQAKFFELAEWLNDRMPANRAFCIMMAKLENASMWAQKALDNTTIH